MTVVRPVSPRLESVSGSPFAFPSGHVVDGELGVDEVQVAVGGDVGFAKEDVGLRRDSLAVLVEHGTHCLDGFDSADAANVVDDKVFVEADVVQHVRHHGLPHES